MKIVLLTNWFSHRMGYIENCLPPALARLGHEVHVVSSTAQVYYYEPHYSTAYEPWLGPGIVPPGIEQLDGFHLHRIPFGELGRKIYLRGLGSTLRAIGPDVVQTFDPFSFITFQAAALKPLLRYHLFTANHTVASVFPMLRERSGDPLYRATFFLTRTIPGRLVSLVTSRCYPATIDAEDIAHRYYGIPSAKMRLLCLGVDTGTFRPVDGETAPGREVKRRQLGVREGEILCIYTGRFTTGKNPLCLAKAIGRLRAEGAPFRGLFLGNGEQATAIAATDGCAVHGFVPHPTLPDWYRAAEIGVWPREESTSMLDAAACGLPIVISDRVQAVERVQGNGLVYEENDIESLCVALRRLEDPALRRQLGEAGTRKIRERFSWDRLAQDRVADYESFVGTA